DHLSFSKVLVLSLSCFILNSLVSYLITEVGPHNFSRHVWVVGGGGDGDGGKGVRAHGVPTAPRATCVWVERPCGWGREHAHESVGG
ncbi:unnamed protein product, partial [Ectocarpus sp. 6 AP-2014]